MNIHIIAAYGFGVGFIFNGNHSLQNEHQAVLHESPPTGH